MPRRPRPDEPSPPPTSPRRRRSLVLSRDGARALDAAATARLGIPGVLLMERASLEVARLVVERIESGAWGRPSAARPVLVVCGPGSNGGDGHAIARHLAVAERPVVVARVGAARAGTDAALMHSIVDRLVAAGSPLEVVGAEPADWPRRPSLVIDALLGTGLDRPVSGEFAEAIAAINRLDAPIVAVDLPSGLDADRGEVLGGCVRADLTITFAAPKPAMRSIPAQKLLGEVVVADLGLPPSLLREFASDSVLRPTGDPRAVPRPPRVDRRSRGPDL